MIKQIELRRFKKFRHTTIELCPLSVLVGENSSGKTTILQAINLALHAFARLKLYSTDEHGIAKPRRKGVGQTQLPGFLNSDFRELYYAKKSRNSGESGREIGTEITLVDDRENTFRMQISSLFGGYNLTPLSTQEQISNEPDIHKKEGLLISGFVGLASSEEKALSLSIRNKLRDGKASEIIRNLLLDTKLTVPDNYTKLISRLKQDFNFIIDTVDFDDKNDINVYAYYDEKIGGRKVPFDFCACGSGMMQVLQIITPIYRYCPVSATVVLLDEPDAHLHANMQIALFYSLREIQKELGIQILISTHSTAIISAASPCEIIPISDIQKIEPLTNVSEVEEIISERINSYELTKVKTNGVLIFFEDSNIDYFIRCDQVFGLHCLIGSQTAAYLTGRCKDDKLPFGIKPALLELLQKEVSVFVIRDRDGLTDEITSIVQSLATQAGINYHFLDLFEIESYLLLPKLIYRTLQVLNPKTNIPSEQEIQDKIFSCLMDSIRLARYNYTTGLEDNLSKLSVFHGLEVYRTSNEYRRKAGEIRETYESITDFEKLRKVGMGKETLKSIMRWLCNEKHLRISKRDLINGITREEIPIEIQTFFNEVHAHMN